MSENEKFCPNCGAASPVPSKFCQKCGGSFTAEGPASGDSLKKVSGVLGKIASVAQKAESTLGTAAKVGSAAKQVSAFTVRPPTEWKVVVGDMLPGAGQMVAGAAMSTATQKMSEEVAKRVQETARAPPKPSAAAPTFVPERVVPPQAPAPVPEQIVPPQPAPAPSEPVIPIGTVVCMGCGATVSSTKKFCPGCGTKMADQVNAQPATPPRKFCPTCGAALKPEKKFCSACGTKTS